MPKTNPVTVEEVARTTLTAIIRAFGDRPLDINTARRGLAQAAFDLTQLEHREEGRWEKAESVPTSNPDGEIPSPTLHLDRAG